ncbi:cytochrome P450 [Microtetraspora sp. NBRC 13810]|uniref:cytochrome P450 n=1 Tax=Microtetraspora sp. NBRC 13810 TaxID=3030990 RepID=UPI0024A5B9AD|nr:cytochrome P450 [Microtetraspora sp. NBRC 13810]GLW10586.1 cytochrome P450 [Microtetraspora sp. NBRC 13810]
MTNPYESKAPSGCPAHPESIRLYGPRYQQAPAQLYREMRQSHGPVVPVLLEGDIFAWLVIGYRELRYVLSNPLLFARDSRRWNAWEHIPPDWPLMAYISYQPSMLFTEGAEHQRRAKAISDALGAADQFDLRTHCESVADQLIDTFIGTGRADLMAQYAHPIPLMVVASMFGLSDHETTLLVGDVSATMNGGENAMEAYGRVQATMHRLLDAKRKRPGHDLPSRLLAHAAGLADDEIIQDLILLMTAGKDTTANWIGNTLRLMLTDDRFAVTLSGGRSSAGQALNEVLWEDSPSQNSLGRWAVVDTQLGGQLIRAGDALILGLAAANADPLVRPDSFGGSGGNHAHMSFGHGEHGCPHPAPEIAELIAHTAVEVLLDRLPDVILSVAPDALIWRTSIQQRGLSALPVKFTPGYPTGRG